MARRDLHRRAERVSAGAPRRHAPAGPRSAAPASAALSSPGPATSILGPEASIVLREGGTIAIATRAAARTPEDLRLPAHVGAQFRSLADVARVATAGTRHDLLRRVAVAAMLALDGASVSLSVWEAATRQFRCILNDGELGPGEVREPSDEVYALADFDNLLPLIERQVGVICSVDQVDQADPYVAFLRRLGKGSSMAAPIPLDGRVWGELFVTRRLDQSAFTHPDVDFAVAVAAQVGAAIATAENIERAEILAHTDALTGLANRRAVDDWFEGAMAAHRKTQVAVGLLVCDVNGLKTINDEHGHDAGDRVLQQFGQLLVGECRERMPDAMVARIGGDEFCVAIKGTEPDGFVRFSERVAAAAWKVLPFGMACGVAVTGDAVGSIDTTGRLFRLADAAQYRAKRTGSRLPVVAGRLLPIEASAPIVPRADTPDRRLLRGKDGPQPLNLLDAALRALDLSANESVTHRLGLIADVVSHQVDAIGWWLSTRLPGTDELETCEYAIYRALPGLTPEELVGEVGMHFALSDYPATVQALAGGAFTVRADDPKADPGELAILDDLSAVAVVGAGGVDDAGTGWLVEVYTDALSGSERDLATLLRVLVLAALNPAAPSRATPS